MNKQQKQREIFKAFSGGDELVVASNRYFKVNRNNKNNHYFLVLKQGHKYENKIIFDVTNDENSRFLMRWKVWETNYPLDNKKWIKASVVVLNSLNEWDKKIIDSWQELAKGGEELIDINNNESIEILKW